MNIGCQDVPQEMEAVVSEISDEVSHLKDVQISANGYAGDHLATAFILCKAINSLYDDKLRFAEGWFGHEKHCWLVWRKNGKIFDILPQCFLGGPIVINNTKTILELYKESRVCNFGIIFDHCIRLVADAMIKHKNSPGNGG